ncbi:glycosyltransferase family 9 protein [Roseomonas sp. AR75]|uniref:glycosyltransferase family 9 protein n=1 Tax=Roseomonas sp. AR75 TaxID=2562311 RepID=UPI0010C07BBB|nr:glycosyltransferase family 9 protein [Roseomonas sp. AR75]
MTAPPDLTPLLRAAEALRAAGRHEEAVAAFRTLAALAPADWRFPAGLAISLFFAGRWDEAWDAYDVRFHRMGSPAAPRRVDAAGREVPLSRWRDGAPPADLLVRAEQGMGDTIQFARYLPLLRARGRRLRLELDPRIQRLLRPLTEGFEVVDRLPSPVELSSCDAWVPLLDLPRRLGITPRADPAAGPYLLAEPERVAFWHERLATQAGYRVGLVWQGNPNAPVDRYRSAPLAAFLPLAHVPSARLIALQKGPGEEQVAAAPFPIETLGDDFDPGPAMFRDTAAVLATLDLLVTVDTGVAHLAGAMGVPTLLLLHPTHSDWRWLHGREDTVWYPSIRLLRCEKPDAWITAAAKAAAILRARLASGAQPLAPPPGPAVERRERGAADGTGIAASLPVAEALDLLGALAAAADGSADPATRAGLHRRLEALQSSVAAARLGPVAIEYMLALREAHAAFAQAEAAGDGAAVIAAQQRRAGLLRAAATLRLDAG